MMKFYYATGSCSIGMRVILEEIGVEYDSVRIDFASKQQFTPEFRAVNPKGKVPALVRDDGTLLTEYQSTAYWLARSFPDAGLIPADLESQTRTLEALDFMVGSVHMRGFTFIVVPMKFSPSQATQDELQAHGRQQVALGFERLAEILGDKDWLLGDYSIADSALFYLTLWAAAKQVDMPPSLTAFYQRMLDRPAVRRALTKEGLEAVVI